MRKLYIPIQFTIVSLLLYIVNLFLRYFQYFYILVLILSTNCDSILLLFTNQAGVFSLMKKFYVSRMFFYLAIALILGLPFAVFVPIDPQLTEMGSKILMRVFNGMFYGGVLVFAWGGFGLASNLGGFTFWTYSMKKTWQIVFRPNADLGEKKLGSYPDYLAARRKKPEVLEMLLGGLIPALISVFVPLFIF